MYIYKHIYMYSCPLYIYIYIYIHVYLHTGSLMYMCACGSRRTEEKEDRLVAYHSLSLNLCPTHSSHTLLHTDNPQAQPTENTSPQKTPTHKVHIQKTQDTHTQKRDTHTHTHKRETHTQKRDTHTRDTHTHKRETHTQKTHTYTKERHTHKRETHTQKRETHTKETHAKHPCNSCKTQRRCGVACGCRHGRQDQQPQLPAPLTAPRTQSPTLPRLSKQKFLRVSYTITVYSKLSSEPTFENFYHCAGAAALLCWRRG